MLTRDVSALVRFGALACVDALVNSLREAVSYRRALALYCARPLRHCLFSLQYLVLAAETAPFLYEVEEDDDEVRRCCCRHVHVICAHACLPGPPGC